MATAQRKMGWGIIGIGRHAQRYTAPAMSKAGNGFLAAVCSRDMGRAQQFAQQFSGVTPYDSLDAMLSDKNVDILYVASPNNVHKEPVLKAAQAGKHVLCEKPLATNVADARSMVAACRRAGVRLGMGFHLRHNPIHAAMRQVVADGTIGEPLFVEIQYMHATAGQESKFKAPSWRTDPEAMGGGRLVSVGGHAIDLLRFVMQGDVAQLFAQPDSKFAVTQSDELIQVSFALAGGVIGSLSSGALRYPSNRMVVYGKLGTVRCKDSIGYDGGGHLDIVTDQGAHAVDFEKCDVYKNEVEAFVDAVRQGKDPDASGEDGLRVVQITEAAYESARTHTLTTVEE